MDANPRLTIVFAPSTRSEFDQIWDYNEKEYGREHAADYLDFLLDGIETLATKHAEGRSVEGFPQLQGLTIRRSARGHGHGVVYRVDQAAQQVRILHVYHTSRLQIR